MKIPAAVLAGLHRIAAPYHAGLAPAPAGVKEM
jgi:hypothetical protein